MPARVAKRSPAASGRDRAILKRKKKQIPNFNSPSRLASAIGFCGNRIIHPISSARTDPADAGRTAVPTGPVGNLGGPGRFDLDRLGPVAFPGPAYQTGFHVPWKFPRVWVIGLPRGEN